jgi:hypothetical protein
MKNSTKLICNIRIEDTDGPTSDTVQRHVAAELWIDGDDHHLLIEGLLTGKPAPEMVVEQIVRDDLNLSPEKAAQALAALHQDWHRDLMPERKRSAFCRFEVSRNEWAILDRIAENLAETVWE